MLVGMFNGNFDRMYNRMFNGMINGIKNFNEKFQVTLMERLTGTLMGQKNGIFDRRLMGILIGSSTRTLMGKGKCGEGRCSPGKGKRGRLNRNGEMGIYKKGVIIFSFNCVMPGTRANFIDRNIKLVRLGCSFELVFF